MKNNSSSLSGRPRSANPTGVGKRLCKCIFDLFSFNTHLLQLFRQPDRRDAVLKLSDFFYGLVDFGIVGQGLGSSQRVNWLLAISHRAPGLSRCMAVSMPIKRYALVIMLPHFIIDIQYRDKVSDHPSG